MSQTKIFQDGQVNEARWADPVTIRIRAAIADQVEPQFALRTFDSSIRFSHRRAKAAELHLWGDKRASRYLGKGLFQNLDALTHFQNAHHKPIVGIPVVAERHPELEARIEPVAIHFPQVIVNSTCTKHGTGNASVDCKLRRQFSDVL